MTVNKWRTIRRLSQEWAMRWETLKSAVVSGPIPSVPIDPELEMLALFTVLLHYQKKQNKKTFCLIKINRRNSRMGNSSSTMKALPGRKLAITKACGKKKKKKNQPTNESTNEKGIYDLLMEALRNWTHSGLRKWGRQCWRRSKRRQSSHASSSSHWRQTTPFSEYRKGHNRVRFAGSGCSRLRQRRRPSPELPAARRRPRCSLRRTRVRSPPFLRLAAPLTVAAATGNWDTESEKRRDYGTYCVVLFWGWSGRSVERKSDG